MAQTWRAVTPFPTPIFHGFCLALTVARRAARCFALACMIEAR
jgi:acyl dehydratase